MSVLAAELLKAFTTRLLLWFGLALVAFLALVLSIHLGSEDPLSLTTESTQRDVFNVAGLAAVTAVLLGSILVASEYNHGTINQSFLAVPMRERLVAGKLGAAVVVAAAVALLSDVATLAIAELWFVGRGLTLDLRAATLTPLLGAIGASVVAGAIGLGLGALLRRQTGSIVLILLWLLIGESVIAAVPGTARYAPGHAVASIVTAHAEGTGDSLGVWSALATGIVYAVVFVAAGALAVVRSDAPSTGD